MYRTGPGSNSRLLDLQSDTYLQSDSLSTAPVITCDLGAQKNRLIESAMCLEIQKQISYMQSYLEAWKGLTSWLSCIGCFLVFFFSFPIWCPGSGVVFDCMDS